MNIGILSGHLTADATFTPGTDQSKNRAKFKLAVSDSYDKNLVSFYTCIAFGPKGEMYDGKTEYQKSHLAGDLLWKYLGFVRQ